MNPPDPCIDRRTSDLDEFWQKLTAAPFAYDLYHLLRWLDARGEHAQLLGRGPDQVLRLGQEPSMAFAPSTIASVSKSANRALPKVSIFSFGLFGPNGPLPLHLTEFARDRQRNYGDDTLAGFADIFHHRLILLFYRAWADAQATASLDRPTSARFDHYVASLIHLGLPAQRGRDSVPDHARYYFSGHQTRLSRNPEGLQQMLRQHLQIPVAIQEYSPRWLAISQGCCGCLARTGPKLAQSALLGIAVRDVQSGFRLLLGPLSLDRYQYFLPSADGARLLLDWVRHYLGIEFEWDLQLALEADQVPRYGLGRGERLGWSLWLGTRTTHEPATDLYYSPERWLALAHSEVEPAGPQSVEYIRSM